MASEAAKEWALIRVVELTIPAKNAEEVIIDLSDAFDAGFSAAEKRLMERLQNEVDQILAAGIKPSDPQGFFMSGPDALDTLLRRMKAPAGEGGE